MEAKAKTTSLEGISQYLTEACGAWASTEFHILLVGEAALFALCRPDMDPPKSINEPTYGKFRG